MEKMSYLINNAGQVGVLFLQHLRMTAETLAFALAIAIPLGVLINRVNWLRGIALGFFSVVYTIPSLSFFVLLIPLTGLGLTSAVIALVAYAQFMLVRNWLVGLSSIDPATIEAARGMGMNGWQLFWQVEFPLALPLLLAGIRLAPISTIGIGTIAAYINAGGLGTLLFIGVTTANYPEIVAGSLTVSALAIAANYLIRYFERRAEIAIHGKSR
jgi:osmoprotectant transport system permease protein